MEDEGVSEIQRVIVADKVLREQGLGA